jgi:hypothetical protein
MPYFTVGGAFGNQTETFPAIAETSTRSGIIYGGGVEINFSHLFRMYNVNSMSLRDEDDCPVWTGRIDYRHTSYNKADTFGDLHTRWHSDAIYFGAAVHFAPK